MPVRALLISLCAVAFSVTGAQALGASRIVGDCVHPQTRPATVILTCADAGIVLRNLRWSSFGGASAAASGSARINSCRPNCAAGRYRSYPIHASASAGRRCPQAASVYRRITVHYTGALPPGVSRSRPTETFTLPCPSR